MFTAEDCGLIVFLRSPVKGKVKTRIASTLGEDKALEIYLHLSSVTLSLASKVELPVYLFYEGAADPLITGTNFTILQQSGRSLGDKMKAAFAHVFRYHSKAIIIGSDCPFISLRDIETAHQQLDQFQYVIGPSKDGGYYLLGMQRGAPDVFKDIAWSTPKVLKETIGSIETKGNSFTLLRELYDIDTEEEWASYQKKNHLRP